MDERPPSPDTVVLKSSTTQENLGPSEDDLAEFEKELAKMVTEFGTCIDKSKGRTITKDALGFLHGLADRLQAMP